MSDAHNQPIQVTKEEGQFRLTNPVTGESLTVLNGNLFGLILAIGEATNYDRVIQNACRIVADRPAQES